MEHLVVPEHLGNEVRPPTAKKERSHRIDEPTDYQQRGRDRSELGPHYGQNGQGRPADADVEDASQPVGGASQRLCITAPAMARAHTAAKSAHAVFWDSPSTATAV